MGTMKGEGSSEHFMDFLKGKTSQRLRPSQGTKMTIKEKGASGAELGMKSLHVVRKNM